MTILMLLSNLLVHYPWKTPFHGFRLPDKRFGKWKGDFSKKTFSEKLHFLVSIQTKNTFSARKLFSEIFFSSNYIFFSSILQIIHSWIIRRILHPAFRGITHPRTIPAPARNPLNLLDLTTAQNTISRLRCLVLLYLIYMTIQILQVSHSSPFKLSDVLTRLKHTHKHLTMSNSFR